MSVSGMLLNLSEPFVHRFYLQWTQRNTEKQITLDRYLYSLQMREKGKKQCY